jgi:hypothetical protein
MALWEMITVRPSITASLCAHLFLHFPLLGEIQPHIFWYLVDAQQQVNA